MEKIGPFGPQEILAFLPHRYPFLFVDRVELVTPAFDAKGQVKQVGTKVVGYKTCTFNEPYFMGHFPGMPITPGVVLIETMAQVASFTLWPWVKGKSDPTQDFELRLAGIDQVRFRKPVVPGDTIRVHAEVTKYRNPLWGFTCRIENAADQSIVAEGQILASVVISPKKG